MPSMQDIESRLAQLERKLQFMMQHSLVTVQVPASGLADASGAVMPPKTYRGTMEEIYTLMQHADGVARLEKA